MQIYIGFGQYLLGAPAAIDVITTVSLKA